MFCATLGALPFADRHFGIISRRQPSDEKRCLGSEIKFQQRCSAPEDLRGAPTHRPRRRTVVRRVLQRGFGSAALSSRSDLLVCCPAAPPSWGAPATRTLTPVASESGGLLTSRSDSFEPCTTSTSVPRLRPSLIGRSSTVLSAPTAAISIPCSRKTSALVGTRTILVSVGSSKSTCA